jgi:hypothetical protein
VANSSRIYCLFKLKTLLEEHKDELARLITNECGKTYAESIAELQRAIENVEAVCGIPSLMQGYNNEDIARGVDEHMIRQPLGVVGTITPFNFPGKKLLMPFSIIPVSRPSALLAPLRWPSTFTAGPQQKSERLITSAELRFGYPMYNMKRR